jgi:uncharacterized membrane protein
MALTVAAGLANAAAAAKFPHYMIYALHNPLGGTYAQGSSVNVQNQIAGYGALQGNKVIHAMLWRNGLKGQDLGTLGGPNSAVAWPNRNDNGVVAGVAETATAQPLGEQWSCALAVFYTAPPTGNVCLGFRWQHNKMTALPTLGGDNGFATGVNSAGQIVGWAETSYHDRSCISPQVLQFEAVVWGPETNEYQTLPPLKGDPDSAATAINSSGQVVGISGLCSKAVGGASAAHMVLWENNRKFDLGSLGGVAWNTPMDINENGDVTGFSDLPGDSASSPNFHTFIWTHRNGIKDLGTLSGDSISEGLGINDQDEIVGVSYPSSHGFIWRAGTMADLNTLIPSSAGLTIIDAQDINDEGVITGEAQDSSGAIFAFAAFPQEK